MTIQFKRGDKVMRINSSWAGTNGAVTEGSIYTVKEDTRIGGSVVLQEVVGNYTIGNFKLVEIPTPSAINAALEILRLAGDVSFTPRKLPFEPISYRIGNYTAVVSDKEIKVGCASIDFALAEKLWNAVQEAKAYNNA